MSSILLVDDDAALMDALSRELDQLNYRTFLAQSADEALDLLRDQDIDVMVTDLRMRGRDGIELLRNSVEVSPATRTVLMSAYATAADYKEARALGAVEVLSKPFTPVEFAAAIRRAEDFQAGFQADIVGLSLVDLLQIFHHGRRSVTVKVGRRGKVHLRDGEIVHAEAGEAFGGSALLDLLQVERGVLATSAPEPFTRSLTLPFETLLLGTLALIDEQNGRAPALPDQDAALMVQALSSTAPGAVEPEQSALATAVAASAPPLRQRPPAVTAEPPRITPPPFEIAPPPASLPAPAPPPRPRVEPDYLSAAGLLLLFVVTLVLSFALPGEAPDDPVDRQAALPPLPAAPPPGGEEVVDPYQHLLDDAPPPLAAPRTAAARIERRTQARVEPAAPPSMAPITAPPMVDDPGVASVASAAPATRAAPKPARRPRPVTIRRPPTVRRAPASQAAPRAPAPPTVIRVPASTAGDRPSVELLD